MNTKQCYKRCFLSGYRVFAAIFGLLLACLCLVSVASSSEVEVVWRNEIGVEVEHAYPGQTMYLDVVLNEEGELKGKQVDRFVVKNARAFQLPRSAEEMQSGSSLGGVVRAPGLVFGELVMSGTLTRRRKWEGGQAFAADLLGVDNTTEVAVHYQQKLPGLPVLPVPDQGEGGVWTGLVGDWNLSLGVQSPDAGLLQQVVTDEVVFRIQGRSESSFVVADHVPELRFPGVRVVASRSAGGGEDGLIHQFDWLYRLKVLDEAFRVDDLKVTVFDPNQRKHIAFSPEDTGLRFKEKCRARSELGTVWLESSNHWVYLALLKNQRGSLILLGLFGLAALFMKLYQAGYLHQGWARWVQFRRLRRITRFCRDGSTMSLFAFRDLVVRYLREAQKRGEGVTLTRFAHELREDQPALAEMLFELENAVWQSVDANDWHLTVERADSFVYGLRQLKKLGGILALASLCVTGCRHSGWIEERVGQELQHVRSSWQDGDVVTVCEGLAAIRKRMMQEGMVNPALMVNEAAACQISGDDARAVVLLTRALLLAPRNEEIRRAAAKICKKLGVPRLLVHQYTWFRPDEYFIFGLALLLLWAVLMKWGRGKMSFGRLKLLCGSALVLALCSAVTGAWLWQRVYRSRDHGIVSQYKVRPVMLPSEIGAIYDDWVLQAGTVVRFVEKRGAWVRIQESGKTAWLHKKAVAPLWSDATVSLSEIEIN